MIGKIDAICIRNENIAEIGANGNARNVDPVDVKRPLDAVSDPPKDNAAKRKNICDAERARDQLVQVKYLKRDNYHCS